MADLMPDNVLYSVSYEMDPSSSSLAFYAHHIEEFRQGRIANVPLDSDFIPRMVGPLTLETLHAYTEYLRAYLISLRIYMTHCSMENLMAYSPHVYAYRRINGILFKKIVHTYINRIYRPY